MQRGCNPIERAGEVFQIVVVVCRARGEFELLSGVEILPAIESLDRFFNRGLFGIASHLQSRKLKLLYFLDGAILGFAERLRFSRAEFLVELEQARLVRARFA